MPKLNLKVSVLSVEIFVIGWDKEKLSGPTGDKNSNAIPVELRNLLDLSIDESKSTPQTFATSIKYEKSKF